VQEFCSECRAEVRATGTAHPGRPSGGVGYFDSGWQSLCGSAYSLCGSMPSESLADAPCYLTHILDDAEEAARAARLGPPQGAPLPDLDGILPMDGSADEDLVAMLSQQERYRLRRAGLPHVASADAFGAGAGVGSSSSSSSSNGGHGGGSGGSSGGSGISMLGGSTSGPASTATVQPLSPAVRFPSPVAVPGAIEETILHAKDRVDETPWLARLLVSHAEALANDAGREDDVARLQAMRTALAEEERRRFGSAAD